MTERKCVSNVAAHIEQQLLARYDSPILSDAQLQKALGYKSISAFRQAVARNTVPVAVFAIANRKGKFALVKDVAQWLAECADAAKLKKS